MIEEEYISFETAKLAKEKGFNEPCRHYYLNGAKEVNNETIMIYDLPYPYNSTDKNYFAAPTQSLLARWLREKHKLFIEVTVDFIRLIREGDSTKYYPIYYYKIVNLKNADYTNNKEEFRFYEEAMEAGLQEALKLL